LLGPVSGEITRPITGLARKSVFGTLGAALEGAAVADLYCGTGTLGLEALSRGAATCWFAERDRQTLERLRRNIQLLGVAERAVVWAGDVTRRLAAWLAELPGPLHVVFVDPPFEQARSWPWRQIESSVFGPLAGRLAADGLVLLRTDRRTPAPDQIGPLTVRRSKEYGKMIVRFYGLTGRQ